jgi:threonine/homoserine efflux transporter RhtA
MTLRANYDQISQAHFAVLGVIADPKSLEVLQWVAVAVVAVASAGVYNFVASFLHGSNWKNGSEN